MITKRNGNGQTECVRCKEKGKYALTWDSFLYTFNDKPYCFNCLMEMSEEKDDIINKAIEYIKNNCILSDEWTDLGFCNFVPTGNIKYKQLSPKKVKELLSILRGEE